MIEFIRADYSLIHIDWVRAHCFHSIILMWGQCYTLVHLNQIFDPHSHHSWNCWSQFHPSCTACRPTIKCSGVKVFSRSIVTKTILSSKLSRVQYLCFYLSYSGGQTQSPYWWLLKTWWGEEKFPVLHLYDTRDFCLSQRTHLGTQPIC